MDTGTDTDDNTCDNVKIITFTEDELKEDELQKSVDPSVNKTPNSNNTEWIHFSNPKSCLKFREQIASQYNVETGALCCSGTGCVVKSIGTNKYPTRRNVIELERFIRQNNHGISMS